MRRDRSERWELVIRSINIHTGPPHVSNVAVPSLYFLSTIIFVKVIKSANSKVDSHNRDVIDWTYIYLIGFPTLLKREKKPTRCK